MGRDGQSKSDDTKKGSNSYDGTGCHFDANGAHGPAIDQTDAQADDGSNLVSTYACECNYAFGGSGDDWERNDWGAWVDQWLQRAKPKVGFESQGWFSEGLAPSWAADVAACWVNHPRYLVDLQNHLYWKRREWNSKLIPAVDYDQEGPASNRPYWGWNEVPVDKDSVNDPLNWDSVVVKLPAGICGRTGANVDSIYCLSAGAQVQLEQDIDYYVKSGKMVPGRDALEMRPGSSIVFVREVMDVNQNYMKEFFCENWESPNQWYRIQFDPMSKKNADGACYIDIYPTGVSV